MQNDTSKFKIDFNKRLIQFSINIIQFCSELRQEYHCIVIADQLVRSGTLIGANVVEAKSSSSKREYVKYFEIALKSANETKYWLILARECSVKNKEKAIKFLQEATEIAKIIAAGILTMKGKKSY
jgi:four helix bundle protein